MYRILPLAVALILPFTARAQAPLSLEDAWESALRHSDDIESARAALERAEAGARRALALLLPVLAVSGTYALNDEEVTVGDSVVVARHSFAGTASLTMPLFEGRAIPGLQVTRRLVDATALRLVDVRQTVMLTVAQAYFAALAARQMVAVAERSVISRRRHLETAEARLEAGHAVLVDVERARAGFIRAERDAIDARHQLAEARDGLAIAMGQAPPLERELTRPVADVAAVPTEAHAMERAMEARADLLALQAQLEAAQRSRLATWLTFLPSVGLTGSVTLAEETFRDPDGVSMGLAITMTWYLYDGTRYAQLDEDEADIRDAAAMLRRQARLVRLDVRRALRDLARAEATTRATAAELEAARRALAAAEAAFQLGTGTGLQVVDAQLLLEQAEAANIREELSLDTARVALKRALGELRAAE